MRIHPGTSQGSEFDIVIIAYTERWVRRRVVPSPELIVEAECLMALWNRSDPER